jgi:hypothetical protein
VSLSILLSHLYQSNWSFLHNFSLHVLGGRVSVGCIKWMISAVLAHVNLLHTESKLAICQTTCFSPPFSDHLLIHAYVFLPWLRLIHHFLRVNLATHSKFLFLPVTEDRSLTVSSKSDQSIYPSRRKQPPYFTPKTNPSNHGHSLSFGRTRNYITVRCTLPPRRGRQSLEGCAPKG